MRESVSLGIRLDKARLNRTEKSQELLRPRKVIDRSLGSGRPFQGGG